MTKLFRRQKSRQFSLIGIAAILAVGGLGWMVINSSSPSSRITFTADEQAPLHLAALNVTDHEICRLLISSGADRNAKNDRGFTPSGAGLLRMQRE